MQYVGSCSQYCTRDATNTYYTSCTYGGVTYRPITTRMKAADLYSCGDGVCQATESCGTGTTPNSCAADCGACPSLTGNLPLPLPLPKLPLGL
jgi:hypothetical protein